MRGDASVLTVREIEVLDGVLAGKTSKEIARELGIAKRTVDAHRRNILKRCGLHGVRSMLNTIRETDNGDSTVSGVSEVREPPVS